MAIEQVAIYGGGGFGRGIAWLAQRCDAQVVCLIDDDATLQGRLLNGLPVMTLPAAREMFPDARVVVAVGRPATRELLVSKAAGAGYGFATLVHPRVELSPWLEIGEGTVIRDGCSFSVNVVLGRHVHVNMNCTVGHDVTVEDFVTLFPGVHVSGYVHLGKRVNVGAGAVIVNGVRDAVLTLGDDAVVGAGAVVTKSVPPGVTVVGVPARPIER